MGSGFDRVPALIGILVCKGFEFDRNSGLFGIRFDNILVFNYVVTETELCSTKVGELSN